MPLCQLNEPPFHQCCCVCRHRIGTRQHHAEHVTGFACELPKVMGENFVFTDWPEHSCGCECWNDNRAKTSED
jgi:hypothetical protein